MTDKDKHTISLNHKQRRYLDARRKREAKKHNGKSNPNRVELTDHIVYTDVRYPNEADFIRSKGGLIIKVVRPGVQPANNHVTEKNVDLIQEDVLLHNDGSKTDLGRSASEHLSQYLS